MKPFFALAACALALSMPSLGSASTLPLYSSLPDSDNSSPNIFGTWSGSGSFTLEEDSILDSATIANWMTNLYVPATLDWAIQTSAGGGVLFSGTGAVLTNDGPYPARGGDYDLYYSTFALPDIVLSADTTYWLHISNCGTNSTDGCGWGLSANPGHDIQFNGASPTDIGKFAFSINGNAAAPEPATWLMFAPALAGLAAFRRRA
jgi:hypothetical protein